MYDKQIKYRAQNKIHDSIRKKTLNYGRHKNGSKFIGFFFLSSWKTNKLLPNFRHLFKTPLSTRRLHWSTMKLDQPWCTRCTIKLITSYWYYANKKWRRLNDTPISFGTKRVYRLRDLCMLVCVSVSRVFIYVCTCVYTSERVIALASNNNNYPIN